MKIDSILVAALMASVAMPAAAAVRYTLRDAGSLSHYGTYAAAINDAGIVAGSSSDIQGIARAYLSDRNNFYNLGAQLSSDQSEAYAINRNNDVAGSYTYRDVHDYKSRAYVVRNGTTVTLPTFDVGFYNAAFGLNDFGAVVGRSNMPGAFDGPHAVVWEGGGIRDLGTLPGGIDSYAAGINNIGMIVGSSRDTMTNDHAFLYQFGTMTELAGLGGANTNAQAINASGLIVGWSGLTDRSTHAVAWGASGLIDLGTLGGDYARAIGVNTANVIVGGSSLYYRDQFGETVYHAFISRAGVMTDLNDLVDDAAGWKFEFATAINDVGQIVGNGRVGGEQRAFVLDPYGVDDPPPPVGGVPEPATWALMLGGFGLTGGMMRRRTRLATVAA